MRSNIFLLGNSPVLLELIINHSNSNQFANKIFVLEDDIYKVCNIINKIDLTF